MLHEAAWRTRVRDGERWLEAEALLAQRHLKQSIPAYLRGARVLHVLTAPVIYSLFLPFVVLDAWVSAYQAICFPIYGIAPVRRRDYFVVDRERLGYLNGIEKANCFFCSYVNGLISYVREVASCTEQFWCPIRHSTAIRDAHRRYDSFFEFGDAQGYRDGLAGKRAALGPQREACDPKDAETERGRP